MLVVISEAVKRFAAPEGGFINALDSVSLDVGDSEFVTLLGPSGCGKTTLLRAISGFEDLDSGSITIDGQAMEHVPPHKRPVNTVFQNYALFPHLSVGDNITYGLEVTGCPKPERKKRMADALELVGLGGFERRKPRQLSGGQQQRVALARAIVNRPKLLLLDEPLSALDRKLRQAMQLELKNIQDELGISFVFVTHDQEEALTMSDRIIVMDHGRVQQMGTPTEIYDAPASIFVAQFIGESNLFEGKVSRDGNAVMVETEHGLRLFATDSAGALTNGGRATVLLRPEDLDLAKDDDTGGGDHALIDATLMQTVFVGSDFQVVAETADGQEIKATIRDPSRRLATHLTHGAPVRFRYRHDATRLLPAETAS